MGKSTSLWSPSHWHIHCIDDDYLDAVFQRVSNSYVLNSWASLFILSWYAHMAPHQKAHHRIHGKQISSIRASPTAFLFSKNNLRIGEVGTKNALQQVSYSLKKTWQSPKKHPIRCIIPYNLIHCGRSQPREPSRPGASISTYREDFVGSYWRCSWLIPITFIYLNMHTSYLAAHATSSRGHSACMEKSFPLYYNTYIQ